MSWHALAVLPLLVVGACSGDGDMAAPAPPEHAATASPSRVTPSGFETVAGRVTAADGSTCEVCLWAALTVDQRRRGLAGVTDLSGADGMLFRFGGPTTVSLWMRDTPLPLSVAFFATDGTFVSSVDMVPCMTDSDADCARYSAVSEYVDAVEVAEGKLADLHIGPGSRLDVLDEPCSPITPKSSIRVSTSSVS